MLSITVIGMLIMTCPAFAVMPESRTFDVDFGFTAYSGRSPTHFSFISEILFVNPTMFNANGSAWASLNLGYDAIILSGDFADNKIFRAEYNEKTVFADLVSAPVSGYNYEITLPQSMPGQISSMQIQWGFTLSARGQASGNGHFQMTETPEPMSILLLGLGGLYFLLKGKK